MSFDWEAIEQSKNAMRRKLAARPIEEKLAMLDVLRERTLALRNAVLVESDLENADDAEETTAQ